MYIDNEHGNNGANYIALNGRDDANQQENNFKEPSFTMLLGSWELRVAFSQFPQF
jgi:hypothetical protein